MWVNRHPTDPKAAFYCGRLLSAGIDDDCLLEIAKAYCTLKTGDGAQYAISGLLSSSGGDVSYLKEAISRIQATQDPNEKRSWMREVGGVVIDCIDVAAEWMASDCSDDDKRAMCALLSVGVMTHPSRFVSFLRAFASRVDGRWYCNILGRLADYSSRSKAMVAPSDREFDELFVEALLGNFRTAGYRGLLQAIYRSELRKERMLRNAQLPTVVKQDLEAIQTTKEVRERRVGH
jgi:hypothetical protein